MFSVDNSSPQTKPLHQRNLSHNEFNIRRVTTGYSFKLEKVFLKPQLGNTTLWKVNPNEISIEKKNKYPVNSPIYFVHYKILRLFGGQALFKNKSDKWGLIFEVTNKKSELAGHIWDADLKSPRASGQGTTPNNIIIYVKSLIRKEVAFLRVFVF